MDVGPAAVAAAATAPETTTTYRSRPEAFPSRGEHKWWPAQVCTPHCTYERGKRSAWRGSVGIGSNCPVTWPPRTSPRSRSSHLPRGYVYAWRIILCKCSRITDLGRLVFPKKRNMWTILAPAIILYMNNNWLVSNCCFFRFLGHHQEHIVIFVKKYWLWYKIWNRVVSVKYRSWYILKKCYSGWIGKQNEDWL